MASRPRGAGRPMDPHVKPLSSTLFVVSVACASAVLPAPARAADAGAAMSLHGDLMTPTETETATVQGALGNGSGHEPKVIYLRYADGTETHTSNYDACSTGKVPKFECTFAPTLVECQRQIQAYLDAWYADFNVIFTLTRPTSGKYYTEVVSSGGGAWCKVDDKVAGVAPFLCNDLAGGVAYTFQGGRNARETAVIIAQEQAHLVGLEHTSNGHDIMFPTISTDTMGFVDGDSPVTGDRCDRETQNSYRMMKKVLGDWPGGPKPSAFGCMEDTQSPTVRFLSPGNGDKMGHAFAVRVDAHDDCEVEIAVMPQGLTAVAMAAPYEWDLTGINGAQTITVTATDGSGRTGSATLEITAPDTREELGPNESDGAGGCSVSSGAFSAAGLVPSLAMFLLFSGKNRRSRLRRVPGALTR
jgi:hypothetical protein